jgi:hypothetical protein
MEKEKDEFSDAYERLLVLVDTVSTELTTLRTENARLRSLLERLASDPRLHSAPLRPIKEYEEDGKQ